MRGREISVWLRPARPLLETWPATQACALTGNQIGDPLVCRPTFNPLSQPAMAPVLLGHILPVNIGPSLTQENSFLAYLDDFCGSICCVGVLTNTSYFESTFGGVQ